MDGFKIILAVFAFIFGAVFASFAGVIAFRAPKGISISKPNSYCPSCKKPIKAYDNIPILSYILLKGKCRYCGSKIGLIKANINFGLKDEKIREEMLRYIIQKMVKRQVN